MNIRDWPMNQVMQLPDNCFGRRWPIGVQAALTNANAVFDISEFALPERAVIWNIYLNSVGAVGTTSTNIGLALGDVLPANEAAWATLEFIFGGVVGNGDVRGSFHVMSGAGLFMPVRKVVHSAGQRIVGRFIRTLGLATGTSCVLTVSSVPTEVPDWMLSAHL